MMDGPIGSCATRYIAGMFAPEHPMGERGRFA
jgi:hypothetical protein